MKKTVLGIVTVMALIMMILSTSVNAASVGVDKTTMKKGEIVTVTVTTEEAVDLMQFDLKFDTTKYKFVEGSIKVDLPTVQSNIVNGGDTVRVSAFSDGDKTTKTVTLQFEAIANGEKVAFDLSNTEFTNDEKVTTSKVEVTIADPKPVEPEKPTTGDKDPVEEQKPEDNKPVVDDNKPVEEKPSTGDEYVDEDGNVIEKLPQAGSVVPSILLGVAVLSIVGVVSYKKITK